MWHDDSESFHEITTCFRTWTGSLMYWTRRKYMLCCVSLMFCYVSTWYVMIMACYDMCFMSCYVVSCHLILLYCLLCYVMVWYVMLCYAMLCNDKLSYAMLFYVMLCGFMLFYVVMLYYAMLCYVMLCYVPLNMTTHMIKHEVWASTSLSYHTRKHKQHMSNTCTQSHSRFCLLKCGKMILNTFIRVKPVLAWERDTREIESGVITCYVMFMLCYVM